MSISKSAPQGVGIFIALRMAYYSGNCRIYKPIFPVYSISQ